MSEIKLKVGQKVRLRNGKEAKVVRFFKEGECFKRQPFQAYVYEDEKYWYYTESGAWSPNGETREDDIIEILEQPTEEKMEENLKEKYSKLVGQTFIVKEEEDDDDEITITDVSDSYVFFNSKNYEDRFDATFDDFEKMKIRKKEQQEEADLWDDEEVAEEQDKYELKLTVVDANGGVTTDKSYYDSLADVGSHVFGQTRGIIDLDNTGTDRSALLFLLKEKGDVAKITRQINILRANVATVIIRVTQLKD